MILLLIFAFVAGIVTILSPCILPILPIILSSTVDTTGKKRPLGVVTGFILSFTFFTLFLSTIVKLSGIPAESLRYLSIIILIFFGLSLFVPKIQLLIEQLFSKLSKFVPQGQKHHGFLGGLIIGLSLGLLWTPCVGPILASVISLALSGTVTTDAALITFAYSLGTAIPMFAIMQVGSTALRKVPWLLKNSAKIQKTFGILMVLTAVGIYFNVDRQFQSYILNIFPQYGVGLTKIEDNAAVRNQLKNVNSKPIDETNIGKPMPTTSFALGPIAPGIIAGGEWFNSKPLSLSELRGKVVLIDFWTYSCINCIRTLPYLRRWWETYEDKGLVIIGVHSPEFEFEKDEKNVAEAIEDFRLTYPVVQDNDFATWRAYENMYWPAKYLIDKDGNIRYTHFGEGAYDETEKVIQKLLKETEASDVAIEINNPEYDVYSQTPELYLGYWRINALESPETIVKDALSDYTSPAELSNNAFSYEGKWFVMEKYANPKKGSQLELNFDSKEVFLVMRPKGKDARVEVLLDGKVQHFGEDVNEGIVTVDKARLYKIIMLPNPGRHILQLKFLDDNVEVYAFTFG